LSASIHIAAVATTRGAGFGFLFLFDLGDESLRGQEKACNAGGILKSYASDLGGVNNTGPDEILEGIGLGVIAVTALLALAEQDSNRSFSAVITRFKVGKHFTLKIDDGVFEWSRCDESIRREEALDRIYVIRTSEPKERLSAEDAVRKYKKLAQVERAFRTLKGLEIRVRPIRHCNEVRVRAHVFIRMLTYYVEWHMRKALAPLLFDDEELDQQRKKRDPVAPARQSASAKRKKTTRLTPDGFPVHSFETLMKMLATRCRNRCRIKSDPSCPTFRQLTEPTPLQARALHSLRLYPVEGN